MIVKSYDIRVGEFKEIRAEGEKWMKEFHPGKHTMFLTPNALHSMFSEERLRLIIAIRKHPDFGVVRLAEHLGRKQEAVSRDVSSLKAYGIIGESGIETAKLKKMKAAPAPFTFNIIL